MPGRVASGPDKAGTCQYCQMVRVRRARWKGVREEPSLLRPSMRDRLEPGGSGPGAVQTRRRRRRGTPWMVCLCCPGGHEEGPRRTHGDAAGMQTGSSSTERTTANTGTIRSQLQGVYCQFVFGIGASTAERAGWGGAVVVLRAGESPAHGEGRQRIVRRVGGCNAERRTAERRRPG